MPLIILSSVDFPEPLRPLSPAVSPRTNWALRSFKTQCSWSPSAKLRLMCLMSYGFLSQEDTLRSIRIAGEALIPELAA